MPEADEVDQPMISQQGVRFRCGECFRGCLGLWRPVRAHRRVAVAFSHPENRFKGQSGPPWVEDYPEGRK